MSKEKNNKDKKENVITYLKFYRFSGRLPYLAYGKHEMVFEGDRGKYFIVADPWVYPWEKYTVLFRMQPKVPSKVTIEVTHSDKSKETLASFEVYEPPCWLVECKYRVSAKTEGKEVVKCIIEPLEKIPFDQFGKDEVWCEIIVRKFPLHIVIVRRGGRARRPGRREQTRTTTLPGVRRLRRLGVLGDYKGYEKDLRSIFRIYSLQFGKKEDRNIILTKKDVHYVDISFGKDLIVVGNLDKAIPLLRMYYDCFRTNFIFKWDARYYLGEKLS